MKSFFKRKNWVINPKLQYRLIALTGGMLVFTSIVIHVLINNFYYKLLNMVHLMDPNNAPEIIEFMQSQKDSFETYSMFSFLILALLFSYFALKETNRIAGPIYNLTRKLKTLREDGSAEEVRFRKGDYFMELQTEFNLLLQKKKEILKDNSEKGFSLIEVVIVMGIMSVMGLGVMRMTDSIQKSQNSMNTGIATRDLVQDVQSMVGFSEICKENFEPFPVPAAGQVQQISQLKTVDGTVKYEVGQSYENNTLELLGMQLQNFSKVTATDGRMDLALLMKKKKATGTSGEFTKFVSIYVTLIDETSASMTTCYAQGGSATSSKAICEDMGGVFDMTNQRCIFHQILLDSAEPPTLAASPYDVHIKSANVYAGDLGILGSDIFFNGGSDGRVYFVNDTESTDPGGFFFGKHETTRPWPGYVGIESSYQTHLAIMNDGRIGLGFDTSSISSSPDIPDGGGTWGNPDTRLFVRGASNFEKHILFGTGQNTPSVAASTSAYLKGFLGGGRWNDIVLGSNNAGVSALSLWNLEGGYVMDLLARKAEFSGICIDPTETSGACGHIPSGSWSPAADEHLKVLGNIVATGNITSGATVTAVTVTATSDKRYKKNITPIKNSLEKLLQIDGFSYNWRKEKFRNMSFDSRKQIGLIAQEVEKVVPEAVHTNKDGFKSVNYSSFIPMIIEALKEVWGKVTDLDEKQIELERKIAIQDEQIKQLKAIVCLDHPEAPDCQPNLK